MSRLDEIEARANAATPGPWVAEEDSVMWLLRASAKQIAKAPKTGSAFAEYWPSPVDSDFIRHARADVPWLIARVRELEAAAADRDSAAETCPDRDGLPHDYWTRMLARRPHPGQRCIYCHATRETP